VAQGSFLNVLDDKIESPEIESSFVRDVLPQWLQHRDEVSWLATNFEREMSPRSWMNRPPLRNCDQATRCLLASLLDALWLARYPTKAWVQRVVGSMQDVDRAFERLMRSLHGCPNVCSAAALRPFRPVFDDFRVKCYALAKAIEELPSRSKVI